jgi:fructose-1-phosphate kinase PfkB-like protein
VPALVDAKGALLRDVLAERPFLVKPNLEEAADTLTLGDAPDAEGAVAALLERGARWAVVSEGEGGSVLGDDSGGRWRVEPPRVEAVNPIGSGDVMAAGILQALVGGVSVPDAAAHGTACAAANVLTPTSGEFDPADVSVLLPRVRLTRLA